MTLLLVAAAIAALWTFRRPPLSAALAAALWLATIDAAPLLLGAGPDARQRSIIAVLFGALVLAGGIAVDGRTRRDHARWVYVCGLAAVWGGVASYRPVTGSSLAAGAVIHASLVLLALCLRRRSFAIFGALGLASVVGRAAGLLEDEVAPFAYAAIALLLAAGALLWARRAASWGEALAARLPPPLRRALPPARRP